TQRDDDLGPVHVAAQRPFFDVASGVAGAAQIHRAQLGATVETYLSLCGDVLEVGGKLELHHRPVRGRKPIATLARYRLSSRRRAVLVRGGARCRTRRAPQGGGGNRRLPTWPA